MGRQAYHGRVINPIERLISMYHGHIGEELREQTLSEFRKSDSRIRVLICTVAFGMGITIQDIKLVVHWGRNKSIMPYWQEVGRCGRDGSAARAIWYPKSTIGEDKVLFDRIKNDTSCCVCQVILEAFKLPEMNDLVLEKQLCSTPQCTMSVCSFCVCCSHCRSRCSCVSAINKL